MKETKFKQTLVQTKDERRKTKEGTRHCERSEAIQGGFKMTEVGMIPCDWEVKPFKNVATLINGRAYSQNELLERGKYRVLRVGNFGTNDSWYYSNLELPEKMYCNKGDLLYCWSCTYGAYIWDEEKTIYHYHIWKIADLKAEKRYLQYILNNDVVQQMNSSNGSTMSHITKDFLENRLFAFPPTIKEQQRIANALSDVDTLIANLEKLIAKKKNIKQGAMQQLLTGKKRLPGFAPDERTGSRPTDERRKECHSERSAKREVEESNGYKMTELGMIPSDWEVKSVGKLLKIGHGRDYKNLKSGNVPVYGTGGYMTSVNDYLYEGETVCIGRKGTIDKPFYHTGKIWTVDTLFYTYGFNGCIPKFIYYAFCLVDWLAMNEASGVPSLTSKNIEDVLLRIPPSKAEQTAIANVLSDMDAEISALETKLAKYRTLKTGMMQQLLTGKIRLFNAKSETKSAENNRVVPIAFKRAVLAAEIAHRLCAEPTFGHVKMEKMLFLAEKMCELDINSSYHRDAAGPYDNRALRSVDSQLEKQKWFKFIRSDKGNHYIPLEKRGGHSQYFDRYYSECRSVFDNIINTFKTAKTEQCEIVATLYSAWEDFLNQGLNPTDDQIVTEVLTNWNESKKRISRDRWEKALSWMKENSFVPRRT